MGIAMRAVVAVSSGLFLFALAFKACPESLESAVYWSLPLFHRAFHPLASGPSPQACFSALALNPCSLEPPFFGCCHPGELQNMNNDTKRANLPLHWTGSSRFSLATIGTALAAAPGQ